MRNKSLRIMRMSPQEPQRNKISKLPTLPLGRLARSALNVWRAYACLLENDINHIFDIFCCFHFRKTINHKMCHFIRWTANINDVKDLTGQYTNKTSQDNTRRHKYRQSLGKYRIDEFGLAFRNVSVLDWGMDSMEVGFNDVTYVFIRFIRK